MKETITVKEYATLEDKSWYKPFFKTYKITKYRDYEVCDLGHRHYLGWKEKSTPVGDPIGYSRMGEMEHLVTVEAVGAALKGNILMSRASRSRWIDELDREHIDGLLPDGTHGILVTEPGYRLEDIY